MTDYYVDYANGSDSNAGTSLSSPLKTLMPFDEDGSITLTGGDNVYLRDTATIQMSDKVVFLSLNATSSNRITIKGYQDEKPTIDFSNLPADGRRGMHFYNCDGYITLEQFIVQEVPGNAIHFDALNGNVTENIIVRDVEMYDYGKSSEFNGNGLIFFGRVYNCRVYDTIGMYGHDGGSTPSNRAPGDSDAFYVGGNGTHGYSGGHEFHRCVAAYNCDDGFDFFDNDETRPSYMYDCVAYGNGQDHPTSPTAYGDGNGFKVGGGWQTGNQYCIRCVSYDNYADGFDTNGASERCFFYDCTSYNNGSFGFQFTGSTDPDHVATNCIAYNNSGGATDALYNCVSTTNTWDLGISNPQFVSTTPGNANFLRLDTGSPCIDAGTDIGYSYLGSAPDLGAYEYGTGTPTYQGTKATSLASMTEPLSISDFSGILTSQVEMKTPVANVNAVGTHTITQSVVDQFTTTVYYIDALNGSDTNTGQSLGDAFASFEPLSDVALSPGDIIRVRDTDVISMTNSFSVSNIDGTPQEPIVIEAYQEENPVIDASGMLSGSVIQLNNVTHFELRDLTIQNAPESGIIVNGISTDVLLENIEVDTFGLLGAGSGIVFDDSSCTNNTARNCTVHHGAWQGTSDGFAVTNGSGGHTFENCTAYRNCDDGFGLYNAAGDNPCTFTRCDAYLNGDDGNGNTGDGNGFKAGGGTNSGGHTFQLCKAWDNTRRGFECSDVDNGCTVSNCTTWSNDIVGYRDNVGLSTFQNNLSWADTTATEITGSTETTNSWNLATGDPTFVSTTYTEGSVGDTFLRLDTGSAAIDVGTDIGLPYSGTSPDLGAHEFATAEVYYVDPVTGDDTNNGLTTGAAFATLEPFDTSTGLVTLAAGDEIQIRSGTVQMTKKLNLAVNGGSGTEVVFKAYPSENPTVSFSGVTGTRQVDISGSYITFDGIDFKDANGNMFYLDGGTNVSFDNVTIDRTGKGGVAGSGIYLSNGSSATANVATVEHALDHGVYVGSTSSLTATDLTTNWNGDDGVAVASTASTVSLTGGYSQYNGGAGVDADSTVTLKKLAAVQNTGDGINVNDTVAATIHNNTTYNNGGTGFVVAGAAHDLTNNLSYDDDTSAFSGDAAQSETTNSWNLANPDPRFKSVTFGEADYLEPYGKSDVIDAGTDVSLAFNDDAPDLGAIEGTEITVGAGDTENGYNLYDTTGSRQLEDFESFTISTDLDGDTANLGFETNAGRIHDGSQGLETTAAGTHIAWFSDSYTGEKETYAETTYSSWHWGWNGVWTGAVYMAQTDSTGEADFSGYAVRALSRSSGNTDELQLLRYDNGVETTLDSWTGTDLFDQQSNPGKIEFTVDTSGNITVDFYPNNAGTSAQTLTATDTTYKTGRLGFYGINANSVMDDMAANTTTAASPAPVAGETASALSDGITATSQIILGGQSATANTDVITPQVTVSPIGTLAEASSDVIQASADLAVIGSLVAAEASVMTPFFQPIAFGNKATAEMTMQDVFATPKPSVELIEAIDESMTPVANIVSYEDSVDVSSEAITPIEHVIRTGEVVVVNSAMKTGEPTVIAIGNKADAEMLLEATEADVVVFCESVESLASMLAGTPLVTAQGVSAAVTLEVLPGIANPVLQGVTSEASSDMTTVSVDVISLSQKAAASADDIPAILTSLNVGAFHVEASSLSKTADTENVTASGTKVKTEAGTFANDSNLQQFNTFYTTGSTKRSIATKGSKQ